MDSSNSTTAAMSRLYLNSVGATNFAVAALMASKIQEDHELGRKCIDTVTGILRELRTILKYVCDPVEISLENNFQCPEIACPRTSHVRVIMLMQIDHPNGWGQRIMCLKDDGTFGYLEKCPKHDHYLGFNSRRQMESWGLVPFDMFLQALHDALRRAVERREAYLKKARSVADMLSEVNAVVNRHARPAS